MRQAPRIFRRRPPGCARASGRLLAPPRAMRCEPCSVRQRDCFSRPRCLPHRRHANFLPAQRAPPTSAPRTFAGIITEGFRLSAAAQHRSCSCPCFTLLPRPCPAHAVVDSPLSARRRPAGRRRATRPVAGRWAHWAGSVNRGKSSGDDCMARQSFTPQVLNYDMRNSMTAAAHCCGSWSRTELVPPASSAYAKSGRSRRARCACS